ncbi:MAG: hypothetical protein BEN19_07190 [Epulopiscium sp. Nuni2H_MBin003]|nr:MAG: hypothetical protein BEN19_07190 [Epulopiscium sp. Nuni2H_MBin003]
MKQKIILDVDTGSDDAIAIITALLSEELEVLGITTVNGNLPVENTTENTLRIVDALGSTVPVYKGCETTLVADLYTTRRIKPIPKIDDEGNAIDYHSEFLNLEPSKTKVQDKNAVCFIIDTIMKSDNDIILVPVGPLTNIATAMRAEPRLAKKIKKIILMGGGYRIGNMTPVAEFNIWTDPEAAQIVLTSGCEVLLVPLDATHAGYMTHQQSIEYRKINTIPSNIMADLIDERITAYEFLQPMEVSGSAPIHDALALCAVIDETVLKDIRFMRIEVDFGGGLCDGMTVVDERPIVELPKNAYMALGCNREKFINMITERLIKNQLQK